MGHDDNSAADAVTAVKNVVMWGIKGCWSRRLAGGMTSRG